MPDRSLGSNSNRLDYTMAMCNIFSLYRLSALQTSLNNYSIDIFALSNKIIRILTNIYQNASTRLRCNGIFLNEIDVTLGRLQEELLSSYLFSLYLSDIEIFAKAKMSEV